MIGTGIEKRIQVQQVIESQLPEYILSESPKTVDFLRQYYISQEHRGGVVDISDNLDQYLKLDNLTPEVIVGVTTLSTGITTISETIEVSSTKGFPDQYGLLKIDNEIISYTGLTTNTFTGCIRGFSGISSYTDSNNPGELVFESTISDTHSTGSVVNNLSVRFLQEFYKKVKSSLTPGLEDTKFVPQIDVSNFIKESKSLYGSKGTAESFRILFNVLYGVTPKIVDLEELLVKPSAAEYIRREIVIAEVITGDPNKLLGQTITKSTDPQTSASISEVEVITRNRKTYYKLSLFVGYNDRSGIRGTFTIPGKSKVIGDVPVGSSVITVDSTVGFGTAGTIVSGINTITYTDKTVNQFLNCTGITTAILTTDDIRSDEIYFGYENGDTSKKVEVRITGVLSNFELIPSDTSSVTTEGEKISVKNLGEVVPNPSIKNSKETFFNSWIYNTSCTFQISSFSGIGTAFLSSTPDKSNLKVGDKVDIIRRGGDQQVEVEDAIVTDITQNNQVKYNLGGQSFTVLPNIDYDLRRKLDRAFSSTSEIQYGNNVVTANVQNVYNKDDDEYYVASTSLPSYDIQEKVFKSTITDSFGTNLQGFSNISQKFSIISFPSNIRFITGDAVFYKPKNPTLSLGGLEEGVYYIEKLTPNNQIKIYSSRSFIPISDNLEFTNGEIIVGVATTAAVGVNTIKVDSTENIQVGDVISGTNVPTGITTISSIDSTNNVLTVVGLTTSGIPAGTRISVTTEHSFVLLRHKNEQIGVQKILKKFPATANIQSGDADITEPGATGILVNGVEITNYKSEDKIYYGPLTDVKLLNGGSNFDVINLPSIEIPQAGSGVTALVQPVIKGDLKEVLVDQQSFDIEDVLSVTIEGGNGTGAVLKPVIRKRFREIKFDGRTTIVRGGIDVTHDQLIFEEPHNLLNGEPLVYDNNENLSIGVGTFKGSNTDQGKTLNNGSVYYPEVIGISSVKLYENINDFNSGINTVGFTTINTQGTHIFKTLEKKNFLRSVVIEDAGTNYTNRKLLVKPSNISTIENTVKFPNHGFADGEVITYNFESGGAIITGLSSTTRYKIITLDNNTFRLANAGAAGTDTSDFDRNDYVKFTSSGTGLQEFAYPNITLSVSAIYSSTTFPRTGDLVITPVVRGPIIDTYLYEPGSNYGSDILNFEKKPGVLTKSGRIAELKVIASKGRISFVDVRYGGKEYFSPPDLRLVGVGTGVGAKLRPVVENGRITDVKIINAGIGYSDSPTVNIIPAGQGQIFEPSVRSLVVNNLERFDDEILLRESETNLQYAVVGYNTSLYTTQFNDPNPITGHSPIIGWAYDGNPIYGPYGYRDAFDSNSAVQILDTGYELNASNVFNRPAAFANGFFVDDYSYNDSGDLDKNNGRYCKTPDYPDGVYAYFVGITTGLQGNLIPKFPYFIGNTYRSKPDADNFSINQTNFDFNSNNLTRNTLPYAVADPTAGNDFFIESNEIIEQTSIVESVTKGKVEGFQIVESGSGYKVNDNLNFNNENTSGGGASAFVSKVEGKEISSVTTTIQTYDDVVYVRDSDTQVSAFISTSHTFSDNDNIVVSGLSTSISGLTDSHKVGVSSEIVVLYKAMGANASAGVVTDIYVSSIPDRVSAGSSIGIGTEKLLVLNTFDERKILRVKRGVVGGTGHALSDIVSTVPQKFTIPVKTPIFESKVNDKVFFNPKEQVGLALTAGTVVAMGKSFTTGERSKVISVPAKSIFLPNHPFVNNQQLTFTIPSGAGNIVCGTGVTQAVSANFNLTSGSTVFAKRISKDLVGLSTEKNGETIFFKTTPTDNFEYLLESNHTQVLGKAQKITAHVAVSTAHNLTELDKIDLTIKPNRSGGVGVSTSVIVKYSASEDKILINPLTVGQANIGADTIFKDDHGFVNGQKIYYQAASPATGLTNNTVYFVYRISDDAFQLGETRKDVVNEPPKVVGISTNTGGANQSLSLINPPLTVVNNNDLVFYVSDNSLNGYNFNLYYDRLFKNEFVSSGTTSIFSVEKIGTVGVGTTSTITLKHHKNNPLNIYYAIEKAGFISTSDPDVENGSRIDFVDSVYDGTYTAFGIGTTSFNISLSGVPEKVSYNRTEIDEMSYLTNSSTASGGVGRINLASGGFGFKKIPGISSVTSVNGIDAKILCLSDSINKINKVRILDPGFEYHSDKTLKPEARISPTVTLINSDLISSIEVTSGGTDYLIAPDIVVVDPETGLLTDQGVIEVQLSSSSISSVDIISPPRGLKPLEHRIRTINNSNGISVQTVVGMANTTSVGVVTCTLVTPIGGFPNPPFTVGDQIFVEGIQLDDPTAGTGYNSTDYGYNFFTISDYQNANPAVLEFNLSGIATAVGVAKTSQQNYATITNFNNYPKFKTVQKSAQFTPGEKLAVRESGNFVLSNLSVLENNPDEFIKVTGKREIVVGNIIRGEISGTVATINSLSVNKGVFNIDYSLEQGRGWNNEIGKLSEDHQVIADNDYYQNLSYAIQSPQTFEEIIDPVNRLIHTSGLKNFADTGITSTAKSGISSESALIINRDLITNERTDTINYFDYAVDTDTTLGGSQSKFLKLSSVKLSSYVECRTNRVLDIDDISSQFSNTNSTQDGKVRLSINDDYESFLIQTKNPATSEIQIDEVVVFKDSTDTFTFERNNLGIGTQKIMDVEGFTDSATSDTFLNITPTNPFDDDLDIKVYRSKFNSPTAGINTLSVGFANIIGVAKTADPSATINLVSSPVGVTSAFYSTIEITDNVTNEKNLVDIYATHDGTNSYFSEYYVDSGTISNFSSNFIGTFTSNLTGGVLSIDFENTGINTATLRSKTIGFGLTSVGIGTFRFKDPAEIAGNERSVNLQSNFKRVSSTSTIVGVDSNKFSTIKSIVKVAYGATIAIHEVLATHNGTDTSIVHYPFISIGSTAGIGTFIANFANNKFNVRFNPDTGVTDAEVSAYSELMYTDLDFFNTPPDVVIGRVTENVGISLYNAVNGNRSNKTEFDLKHGGVPIFAKTFNPANTATVNAVTGEFFIKDHFFNTGEKLKYTPKSTFIGVNPVSMKIGSTTNLPTDVFAIRINKDKFKLATSQNNANAGTGVTFPSLGQGNAHQLEMDKKLEKSIVVVDGLIQSPIAFTPVNTTLVNNGGSISASDTLVSVAGISSIAQGDLLKIGTELLKVTSVGLGTLAIGPITGGGSFKLVGVERGSLGTTAASHNDNTSVRKFKGSFNIIDSKIHFTDPPKGTNFVTKNESGVEFARSDFHGRVYLRKDYSNNRIFDDISDGFTGIGATHLMKVAGSNTTGIQTGGSIVLMNGIFQTPTTENNQGNNYDFIGDTTAGITTITFTGITSTDGTTKVTSESDVNLNQLPRGGMIVSLGSTGGLGVAPLAGAAVTAVKNNAGQITAVGIGTLDRHGSGYRGSVAIGITDIAYEHRFVRSGIGSIRKGSFTGQAFTATNAVYTSHTGYLDITLPSGHGLTTSDTVGIDTGGLVFTCSKDHFVTEHPYPRSGPTPSNSSGGDPIVGIQTAITAVNGNVVTIFVGQGGGGGTGASITATVGAGGTLTFAVAGAGISYTNPQIIVPDPSYEDLEVIGVSRLGIGPTTDTGFGLKVSINVGASATVGVGSTLHTVESFKITRNGFGFKKGDVIRPVGLVTALGLSNKVSEFDLTVTEIFTDNFASWDFGEFDNIDNIKNLQDGVRTRFPLRLNGQLLSFEIDNRVDESSLIDMKDLLLIFVNGVLQEPGDSYSFEGGTTFEFTTAPEANDDISVFFYKGTTGGSNPDTVVVDVAQTLKKGDVITVGALPGDITDTTQNPRTVIGITTSDTFETEIYNGPGIGNTFKPVISWKKQKIDKIIGGDVVSKARDSLTSLIFPTARIIGNLGTGNDPDIFVDDAQFFEYEEDHSSLVINSFGALIVNDTNPIAAALTATVSAAGTISEITVVDGGKGYVGSTTSVSIAAPLGVAVTTAPAVLSGIATFATATATITNGSIASVAVNSIGLGYTTANPPKVIAPIPEPITEKISNIRNVQGFSGIITSISVTSGGGSASKGLRVGLARTGSANFNTLAVGYPIYLFNTTVGNGVTSIATGGSDSDVIGIGTLFADNIYTIQALNYVTNTDRCEILVNVHSNTNVSGLSTSYSTSGDRGNFSWGRLFTDTGSMTREDPISLTVTGNTVGLSTGLGISTFPTIERRVYGVRDTGAVKNKLS